MSTLENKWAFVVRPAELFLLGPDPMITIPPGLEVEVEISTFGVGGEEGGMLLGGHIEVLIDLSTLSKFQLQHSLFRSIADAGDTAGIYRSSSHDFLDADGPGKDRGRGFLPSIPRAAATDEIDETQSAIRISTLRR